MSDRDSFKITLHDRGGTFYKFYENGFLLRYGSKNKYFFEGRVFKSELRDCKSISGNSQKFIIVFIDSFDYVEGKIPFDATVNSLDGEKDSYMVFILAHRISIKNPKDLNVDDLKNKYLEQIIQHEMNHFRTYDLLSNFKEENNKFVSEILADTLLIFENSENEDFINIKKNDIDSLLEVLDNGFYYKDYLEVVKEIITSKNPRIISELILNSLRNCEIKDSNINGIKKELLEKITTANKELR